MRLSKLQEEGVSFVLDVFTRYRAAFLADVPGLGKTRMAIEVASRYCRPGDRILYVCPASLTRQVTKVLNEAGTGLSFQVVPYSALQNLSMALAYAEQSFKLCILDEAHKIKGLVPGQARVIDVNRARIESGARAQAAKRKLPFVATTAGTIFVARRAERVLYMSGTPYTRDPRDLFLFLWEAGHPLVKSHSITSAYYQYCLRYTNFVRNAFGGQFKGFNEKNIHELEEALADVLIKREHADETDERLRVPEPVTTVTTVPVPEELQIADEYVLEKLTSAVGYDVTSNSKTLAKLVGTVPGFTSFARFREAQSHAKIETVVQFLTKKKIEKCLLFVYHRSAVPEYVKRIREALPGLPVAGLTGGTSLKRRAETVEHMNALDRAIIVATMGSIGTGFDCNRFSVAVFAELDWSPAVMEQSRGRVLRKGSGVRSTIHYILFKTGVEPYIRKVLRQKKFIIKQG